MFCGQRTGGRGAKAITPGGRSRVQGSDLAPPSHVLPHVSPRLEVFFFLQTCTSTSSVFELSGWTILHPPALARWLTSIGPWLRCSRRRAHKPTALLFLHSFILEGKYISSAGPLCVIGTRRGPAPCLWDTPPRSWIPAPSAKCAAHSLGCEAEVPDQLFTRGK